LRDDVLQVPPLTTNSSVDEIRRLELDYSQPEKKTILRRADYLIDELAASSVYGVAIRTRNGFGSSDWTREFFFETAPGIRNFLLFLR